MKPFKFNFKNNKSNGEFFYYNESGKLIEVVVYRDGNEISRRS